MDMKARQSITRNLEREDAALVREERYQEQLLYGGHAIEAARLDKKGAGMDDDLKVGDIAGDVTIHVPPKTDSRPSWLQSLAIPLLTLVFGSAGGAGIAALISIAMQTATAPQSPISSDRDIDTIGVLELDRQSE